MIGGPFTFYLGTHHPHWLKQTAVPLFVSRRAIARVVALPRALGPWALDSGGFTELSMHGAWQTSPREYVAEVRRFRDEIGSLDFAAPQDWMCEPIMLAKTGLTVAEHQRRTTANFLELRALAPELPIIPVIQGWGIGDYWRHAEDYALAGVDLCAEPRVGVGTVCRRQHTLTAVAILDTLADAGLRLHAFGFKAQGLRMCREFIASADSLAWSYHARREPPMPGHEKRHKNCANCIEFALEWRDDLLGRRAMRGAA